MVQVRLDRLEALSAKFEDIQTELLPILSDDGLDTHESHTIEFEELYYEVKKKLTQFLRLQAAPPLESAPNPTGTNQSFETLMRKQTSLFERLSSTRADNSVSQIVEQQN